MSSISSTANLQADYAWLASPAIISAPMARVSKPPLAVAVSQAGGLGFIAAGYSSDTLDQSLAEASTLLATDKSNAASEKTHNVMPIGVGFIAWSASLDTAIPALQKYRPCAVWLFAPAGGLEDLILWATRIRDATSHQTKIWVQVGSVGHAVEAATAVQPDVLVVQGSDAGGHGLARGASLISLLPEIKDKLQNIRASLHRPISLVAAGGISDGRGVAAAVVLGAEGCVLGTRFLASPEALIPDGYQSEILRASDGGSSTVRTRVYDKVRGLDGWPEGYNGRGLVNRTYVDAQAGLEEDANRKLYNDELDKGDQGYGPNGRLTTYAGTGVGLIRGVMPAKAIVASVLAEAHGLLSKFGPISRL